MNSVNNLGRLTRGLLFLSLIFCCCRQASIAAENSLASILQTVGFSMQDLDNYSIVKNFVRSSPDGEVQTLVAEWEKQTIRFEILKNVTPEFAANYSEAKRFTITSLYRTLDSPYPGMITNKIECPKEYHPELIEHSIDGQLTPVLILFSTPRLTYGACSDDLISYKGAFTVIYDPSSRNLFQLEIFEPKSTFVKTEILQQLTSIKLSPSEGMPQPGDSGAAVRKSEGKDYPNLLIIGFDPLGANHLPMNGYQRMTTPNLAALAKRGYYFTQAISPSSWTVPTFMTWFTSLYPTEHKITNKYRVFVEDEKLLSNLKEQSPSVVTLAQVLQGKGYRTAAFTGDAGVNSDFGYDLGFETYYDDTPFAGFDVVLPKAEEWLRSHKDEKYFLFLQAYDVHGRHTFTEGNKPAFIDPAYDGKYKGTPDEYWALRDQSLEPEPLTMAEVDIQYWRDWYDSKIFDSDRQLGVFLDKLTAMGALENTVIVISSASGNEFYEHKHFDHGYSVYEELIRVPLLILIPNKTGSTIDAQVRTLDIMPTVLDLLGLIPDQPVRQQMRGVSLLPLMQGEQLELVAYSETDYLLQYFKRSIRTPDGWKFIFSLDTGERELFNLKSDPQEQNNLVNKEPERAKELEIKLLEWMKSTGQDQFYHKEILKKVFKLE